MGGLMVEGGHTILMGAFTMGSSIRVYRWGSVGTSSQMATTTREMYAKVKHTE